MVGTFWAFVPAIVAIVLALITKHVYISLFVGIFTGAMFYMGGDPIRAILELFNVMSTKVGENVPIIVFLVVLGIFVILMQRSGGAVAYGQWAEKRVKTKRGVLGMTAGLGCLIFMDDYFNCLTVGSVMRPLTDKHKVSRSKLAYLIDSTAAPICIIAPISSWAAAVGSNLSGDNSIITFIKTIPFNIYALLTIVMVFVFIYFKTDFGKMRKDMRYAEKTGDVNAGLGDLEGEKNDITINPKGRVLHLILPVVILITFCIGAMIYSGYFYDWTTYSYGTVVQSSNVIEAFSNCDAGSSLALGSTLALIVTCIYYACSKAISFKDMMESIPQGFKVMVPAILILVFAWTISGIMGAKGGCLNAQAFVQNTIAGSNFPVALFPAIFCVLAGVIAFATGTSWGTFGILVPLAVTLLGGTENESTLMIMTVSATLGGAVFGDHISPISDTTILASAGANCDHINHVKTQMPYALLVISISVIGYLISGFLATSTMAGWLVCLIMWAIVAVLFVGALFGIKYLNKKADAKEEVEQPKAE